MLFKLTWKVFKAPFKLSLFPLRVSWKGVRFLGGKVFSPYNALKLLVRLLNNN